MYRINTMYDQGGETQAPRSPVARGVPSAAETSCATSALLILPLMLSPCAPRPGPTRGPHQRGTA